MTVKETEWQAKLRLAREALDTVDWLLHADRNNPNVLAAASLTPGEPVKRAVIGVVRAALRETA